MLTIDLSASTIRVGPEIDPNTGEPKAPITFGFFVEANAGMPAPMVLACVQSLFSAGTWQIPGGSEVTDVLTLIEAATVQT